MRVLLSTIGSRGEAQPVAALALQLKALGHEVRVCAPPDFREWIEGLGIPVVPIGPEVRPTAAPGRSGGMAQITPEQRRQMIEGTVATQFATISETARGCDILVGCGALQVAGPSVAELLGMAYVHVHFCPVTLPSPHHPPPNLGWPQDETASSRERWAADAQHWNDVWGPAINAQRAAAGLAPVADVRSYVFTAGPWLAADPTLGPWPETEGLAVFQTGAWILTDDRPLAAPLEAFLDAGAPPVYFSLGSMRAPGEDVSRVMVEAARVVGRRAIVDRGWADLQLPDDGPDCVLIGETNHQQLFQRVAAVVHHGGAGTTTTVARAGAPHVVIPQRYDQPYWAQRVADLGIGVAHAQGMPSVESLAAALSRALEPDVAARARSIAPVVRSDAQVATERLTSIALAHASRGRAIST